MPDEEVDDRIDAMPTKAFFVDMLTKDIPLEQAVLDLVDNSVDGAKMLAAGGQLPLDGRRIKIRINSRSFIIWDNCGGFSSEAARDYAFRFGRSTKTPRQKGSIGQFGVGMKRALFKFGKHFKVRSTTSDERWSIDIDVDEWQAQKDWKFEWKTNKELSPDHKFTKGTNIVVDELRPAVAAKFSTSLFLNAVREYIKSKHRQFIADGLSISLNSKHISATSIFLLFREDLRPGYDEFRIKGENDEADVICRITSGLGTSSPRECGWYVICNGRIVLEADRSATTGWGLVENQISITPAYHNQFARFRGIVVFDSEDSSRVPWNTTKDGVDADSQVWQTAFGRMTEMMRPVIDFLYDLDRDVEEYTREHSALFRLVDRAPVISSDKMVTKGLFAAPRREDMPEGTRQVKIQYMRPIDDIEFLMDELNVKSAKAVGEKSFDLVLKRHKR